MTFRLSPDAAYGKGTAFGGRLRSPVSFLCLFMKSLTQLRLSFRATQPQTLCTRCPSLRYAFTTERMTERLWTFLACAHLGITV